MTSQPKNTSHKEILKATGMLGSVQVIEILVRICRVKIIAVLLGPAGVGIIGLYQSIIDLVKSATGLGIEFSAVRDIAKSVGDDDKNVAQTYLTVTRWCWLTGLLGMALVIFFCRPISYYTFGNYNHVLGLILLSVVLLLNAHSGRQFALIQGVRQIGLMAKAKVYGLLVGFFITIPLYWFFGLDAIVFVFIISASMTLLFSNYFSQKINLIKITVNMRDSFLDGLGMVRLGFFMVITGFISMTVLYLMRSYISNKSGLEEVGLFQSGWSLSSLYLSSVLQAMSTDYFPRLSAVSEENRKVVTLANEQTEIALLIAGPMVIGMISFINLVILILYSEKFLAAESMLHFMLAGTFLKIISWPIAFIMLAKGRGGLYLLSEISSNILLFIVTVYLWDVLGLEAAGVAFIVMYLIYTATVAFIAFRISGFVWEKSNIKVIIIFSLLIFCSLVSARYNSGILSIGFGVLITFISVFFSLYELNKRVSLEEVYTKFINRITKS